MEKQTAPRGFETVALVILLSLLVAALWAWATQRFPAFPASWPV
jgi:hypothetical protein